MKTRKIDENPWTAKDEREHFPVAIEWWCGEAFFTSVEDKKNWCLKTAFVEGLINSKKNFSSFSTKLSDLDNNKHFSYYPWNDSAKLESAKDRFYVRYSDSFMKGSFPNYEMHIRDPENNIELDVKYHAESLPHWIAQDVTNGWLPMGLSFYRYGFIPKNHISGILKINGETFNLNGVGYFEHIWGDFSYGNPLSRVKELKKTTSIYARLIGWWLRNHNIRIPKSIIFSTENNPFGYDWAWAVLDNGWIIFYGNILFWLMKGPAAGTLIFSKDGKTYTEFCNVSFQYNKTRYAKEYDFVYPSELEIIATRGKEKLHLRFTMTVDCGEYVERFYGGKYWLSFVICETVGTVEGYYFDDEKKTKLAGICKIEPQRQVSVIGHNSLKIDFLKPPEGVGISFDLDSHYLKKKILIQMQLAPYPKIKFNFKKSMAPNK